jgi:hypothetical protein
MSRPPARDACATCSARCARRPCRRSCSDRGLQPGGNLRADTGNGFYGKYQFTA